MQLYTALGPLIAVGWLMIVVLGGAATALPTCHLDTQLLTAGVPRWRSDPPATGAVGKAQDPWSMVAIALAQFSYSDAQGAMNRCLAPWGATEPLVRLEASVPHTLTGVMVAYAIRAGDNIFLVFRGTDGEWDLNILCQQTEDVSAEFGQEAADIRLFTNYYISYRALFHLVEGYLDSASKGPGSSNLKLYLVGHSLGAGLALLTALRLQTMHPFWQDRIEGVVTLGAPRTGNEGFKRVYNTHLGAQTLRVVNYRDFAPNLLRSTITKHDKLFSICLRKGQSAIEYRHVGDAVLYCPSPTHPGLQTFRVFSLSADGRGLNADEASTCDRSAQSAGTHFPNAYFDGYRRAARTTASLGDLRNSRQVRGIMCKECEEVGPGPVWGIWPAFTVPRSSSLTCINDESCRNRVAFDAVAAVGNGSYGIKPYDPSSVCLGTSGIGVYLCK